MSQLIGCALPNEEFYCGQILKTSGQNPTTERASGHKAYGPCLSGDESPSETGGPGTGLVGCCGRSSFSSH